MIQQHFMQQQQHQQQQQQQHCPVTDQDLANVIISELKRVAREYATACLEANNSAIRRTFEHLLRKTLQDQEQLYNLMSRLNMYGTGRTASQAEIHQEQQKQSQSGMKLQQFMEQQLGRQGQQGNQQLDQYLGQQWGRQDDLQSGQHLGHYSNDLQHLYGNAHQYNYGNRQGQYGTSLNVSNNINNDSLDPYGSHQRLNWGNAQQTPIQLTKEAHRETPGMSREQEKANYKTPSTDMYQSAAQTSDFNTTGSSQTSSHSTGAVSSEQDNVSQLQGLK